MDFSNDEWITQLSGFYPTKKLHALGAVTFLWNACEQDIRALFAEISGLSWEVCGIIIGDIGLVSLSQKMLSLVEQQKEALKKRLALSPDFLPELQHLMKVFDRCRLNRNQLTHFAIVIEGGQMVIQRQSKKDITPIPIPEDLEDIRRIADEIGNLRQTLTDFIMYVTSQTAKKSARWRMPARLPLPVLLSDNKTSAPKAPEAG